MAKYLQGKFTPTNPRKYVGDLTNIVYRSSWERKLFQYFDMTPAILKWNSEEVKIPYISPVDGKRHTYFVDCMVQFKTRSGEIKKALVEVKPYKQTQPPTPRSKQTKGYITEVTTYVTNCSKWEAAKAWCVANGYEWLILTEHDLGIK